MTTIRIHPLIVRITHWINVLAVLTMITSGWAIYNASPLFDFSIPDRITLGGWLAGALQWHFAGMWLFVLNGLVYLIYGIASGHFRRKLLPISPLTVLRHRRGSARPARAPGPLRLQRRTARCVSRADRRARHHGALRPRHLETGTVPLARHADGRL